MLPKIWKECKCICTHEVWHSLPLYTALHILDDPQSPHQLCKHLIDGAPFSTKNIDTFEYHIYWNVNIRKNKFLYE